MKSYFPAGATSVAPLRVVIVNDSKTMRASLRAALAVASDFIVVAEAADGVEAVEVVARTHPSVVLMDVVMPRSDGYAATRAIMARVPTPIVMVSAVVDPRASCAGTLLRKSDLSCRQTLSGALASTRCATESRERRNVLVRARIGRASGS